MYWYKDKHGVWHLSESLEFRVSVAPAGEHFHWQVDPMDPVTSRVHGTPFYLRDAKEKALQVYDNELTTRILLLQHLKSQLAQGSVVDR